MRLFLAKRCATFRRWHDEMLLRCRLTVGLGPRGRRHEPDEDVFDALLPTVRMMEVPLPPWLCGMP